MMVRESPSSPPPLVLRPVEETYHHRFPVQSTCFPGSSKQAAPSSLCPPAALPWNALRPSADGVWPGVFEGSRQHCEQTGAGEEEDRSEGSRRGGKHRLVLVQPPGCVPSAQCQIPSLASVSPWVPVGIITWLLLPGGLFRLTN